MDYIAVIDYEHLDNAVFLTSFARALSNRTSGRGVIIHTDSAYTERLLQSGIMREEATVRAIRDLNHRLIALLADHGVSAIGLNGYQRSLIRRENDDDIMIDTQQLEKLPDTPHLLISGLIDIPGRSQPGVLDLPVFADLLQKQLSIPDIILFSLDDSHELIIQQQPDSLRKSQLGEEVPTERIPAEFRDIPCAFRLSTTRQFASSPLSESGTVILPDPG